MILSTSTGRQARLVFPTTISQKLGAVFAIILCVAIANVLVVRNMLAESNGTAATINVAGKLRYLSQQITLNTVIAVHGWSPGRGTSEAHLRDFEIALDALTHGGRVFGYDINNVSALYPIEIDIIHRDWKSFRESIENTLALTAATTTSAMNLGELNEISSRMLMDADRLMQAMTIDAHRRQDRALYLMYLLLVVDIMVLAAVMVLVRRQIIRPIREIAASSRQLADGNYRVRSHYQAADEIGQLAEAFNYAAERIGSLVDHVEIKSHNLMQAEAMFRGLAENSVVGVYIAQNGRFRYANAKMATMFGYTEEEMTTSVSVLDLVPEEDRMLVAANVERRLRGDIQGVHYERKARKKNGATFDAEVFGSTMEFDGGTATIGIMLDITERKKAEVSMQLAALAYQHSSEAMTITDPAGVIIDVNPSFTQITGYARDEAIGKRISMLRSGRQDETFYQSMWHALNTTGHWQGEIWNRRKNGDLYVEWLTINTSYNTDRSVYRRIALFSDITTKKKSEDLIWRQANFDVLTQLPNRLLFRDRLEHEIKKAQRANTSLALMFIDLDKFKDVNDTLGHEAGDNLLKQAALRLSNAIRNTDTVARIGGDEFTVILGELSEPNAAERVAQSILVKMAEPFVLDGELVYVSASIGVTFYPDDAAEAEELLKNADQAMYAAKENGRNRYHYFTPQMQEHAQERRRISGDLRKSISQHELRLHYQPIVDLRTGELFKAEALLRWVHPLRGMVSPAEFIPIAEETGQIVEIGEWVFREAARQLARWRVLKPNFQVSVNTSPVQYHNGGMGSEAWFAQFKDLDIPLDGIVMEITEGLLMKTTADIKQQLARFREAGIQISLDDFGTGYSSLSYLNKLDIDYLKIDRSFLANLGAASNNVALYEAMIVMAHKLGIRVVAEGIETPEQQELLQRIGCDYGQGFFFSRPVPADQLENLLLLPADRATQANACSA